MQKKHTKIWSCQKKAVPLHPLLKKSIFFCGLGSYKYYPAAYESLDSSAQDFW